LGQNTTFCNLVGLRSRYYTGKCTKEEKEAIRNMGDMFHVPQNENLTLDEREAARAFREDYEKAKQRRDEARSK